MDIHSIRNSAHNNWLLPGTAILGGQTAAEWQNWVLHYFCVLVRPHDLSCLCSTWAELRVQGDGRASMRDLGGVNQHVQCLGKKLGSMGSQDEGAGDALSCSFGMLACLVCTEELFCRVPTQESQVGEVQWESELLAPDYLLIPCPEFSCCSPFHCQLWQYQCKSHPLPSPSFCHRGGVWELIVTARTMGTVFSCKSATAEVSKLALEPLEC